MEGSALASEATMLTMMIYHETRVLSAIQSSPR